MPAAPADPLIGSFIRRKRNWSDRHVTNAIATYNRWHAWLAAHDVTDLTEATGDLCAEFLAERARTVSGSTNHKDWQFLVWFYTWLRREGELPPITRRGQPVEQIGRGPMEDIDAPQVNDPDPDRVRHISTADYRKVMASFDKRKLLDCRNARDVLVDVLVRCAHVRGRPRRARPLRPRRRLRRHLGQEQQVAHRHHPRGDP